MGGAAHPAPAQPHSNGAWGKEVWGKRPTERWATHIMQVTTHTEGAKQNPASSGAGLSVIGKNAMGYG